MDDPSLPAGPDPSTALPPSRFWRRLVGGLVLTAGLAAALYWLSARRDQRPAADAFPVPPLSESPFKNTGSQARYVGSESCQKCHQAETASFRHTGMGISMAAVDPNREPPDGVFSHVKSKRRYEIVRKDGQVWQRESLLSSGSEPLLIAEHPLKYVVGSGRHARTYLVEADGFLVESPVTWYTSRKTWDMSPGYDRADQPGFERPIGEDCLTCHAGRAEAVARSRHKMIVSEPALGCERCHGPGSMHVERWNAHRDADPPLPGMDDTIVNPNHLSRNLAEAICQQCHLHTAASVLARGRHHGDFRPGLPLEDFRQDYGLEADNRPMSVVGHVEQMHLSRCYTQSATLTCTTCHDPHGFPTAEAKIAYYQSICASCHKPERCKVNPEQRRRESPENDCVRCHMPRSDTEVPHVSFTHHRIAVHNALGAADAPPDKIGTLRPFLNYARLADIDKKRSLGLAYLNLAKEKPDAAPAPVYKQRAFALMSSVWSEGLKDAVLESELARLSFEQDKQDAFSLAKESLAHPDVAGTERCSALFVLAAGHLKLREFEAARAAFLELTQLRRHPHDWLLLADCEKGLGRPDAAMEALRMVVRINPRMTSVHEKLARYFWSKGDGDRAAWHQKLAKP